MSFLMKSAIPLMIFALLVPGCDQGKPARPVSNHTPPPPPSDEQVAEWENAIVEFHKKFNALLITATRSLLDRYGSQQKNLEEAEAFLKQIDMLDISSCPDYYRKGYDPHKKAWVDFFKLIVKNKGDLKKTGSMPTPPFYQLGIALGFGNYGNAFIELNSSDQEYRDAIQKIAETTNEYSKAADRRGNLSFKLFY